MAKPIRSYALSGVGIDGRTVRLIAVEADVDPRTVVIEIKAQLGQAKPVRGAPGHRVRAALACRGIPAPANSRAS